MKGLHALYGEKRLAIVRGVGYPKPDRSHFRSMDIWQTAQPDRPGTTGWLGRWLDTAGRDPRLAVSFEPVLPPLLAGATSAGATVPGGAVKLPKSVPPEVLQALAGASAGEPPAQARAAACFADLLRVQDLMADVAAAETDDDQDDAPATATGGAAPPLDTQLALVAKCIEAGRGDPGVLGVAGRLRPARRREERPGVAARQAGQAARGVRRADGGPRRGGRRLLRVRPPGEGQRLGRHRPRHRVLDVPARRRVQGGMYGDPPSLTDLDDGDLRHTVDFRDVYGTLLGDVLGADPEPILGGWPGRLEHILVS